MDVIRIFSNSNNLFWQKLDIFRSKEMFLDCRIITDLEQHNCHKIILSYWSEYFSYYFQSHQETEVSIPENPENIFPVILNFFYSRKIKIDESNISAIYKCAEFYKIKSLQDLIAERIVSIILPKNVLPICKKLYNYGISAQDDFLADLISKYFLGDRFTHQEILQSVSPSVLAKILNSLSKSLTDSEKIALVDSFYMFNINKLDETEKNILSSIIDWSDSNSYKFLITHKCDWLPSNISRSLFSKILNLRRTITNEAEKNFMNVKHSSPNLYPLCWICDIQDGEISHFTNNINDKVSCEFDYVEFLETLGGLTNAIKVAKYGFIQIGSSPYLCNFMPEYALERCEKSQYFLSIGSSSNLPYLSFSFGKNQKFYLTRINFDATTTAKLQEKRPAPKSVWLEGAGSDAPNEYEKIASIDTSSGKADAKITTKKPFSFYRIVMAEGEIGGGWIFRVKNLKLFGYFYTD